AGFAGPRVERSVRGEGQRADGLARFIGPPDAERPSRVDALPDAAGSGRDVDGVRLLWIDSDVQYAPADIGRAREAPASSEQGAVRCRETVDRDGLVPGSRQRSGRDAFPVHALAQEPFFRFGGTARRAPGWRLLVCQAYRAKRAGARRGG